MAMERTLLTLYFLTMMVMAVAAASYEDQKSKADGTLDVHGEPKCRDFKDFKICAPYVKKGSKWNHVDYHSPCCKLIFSESSECLCKAISYSYNKFDLDLDKAIALPKRCGKNEDHQYPCDPPTKHRYPPPHMNHHPPPHMNHHPPPHMNQYPPPHMNQYPPPHMNQYPPPHMNQYPPPHMNQYPPPHMNQYPPPHMNQYPPPHDMNQYPPPHGRNPNASPPPPTV